MVWREISQSEYISGSPLYAIFGGKYYFNDAYSDNPLINQQYYQENQVITPPSLTVEPIRTIQPITSENGYFTIKIIPLWFTAYDIIKRYESKLLSLNYEGWTITYLTAIDDKTIQVGYYKAGSAPIAFVIAGIIAALIVGAIVYWITKTIQVGSQEQTEQIVSTDTQKIISDALAQGYTPQQIEELLNLYRGNLEQVQQTPKQDGLFSGTGLNFNTGLLLILILLAFKK